MAAPEDQDGKAETELTPVRRPGPSDDPWALRELRMVALNKATECRKHDDDDHALVARAGRFYDFLKGGTGD